MADHLRVPSCHLYESIRSKERRTDVDMMKEAWMDGQPLPEEVIRQVLRHEESRGLHRQEITTVQTT